MAKLKIPKPQKAFAALDTSTGWIATWTICGTTHGVREAVGRIWSKEDPANGWKAARLEGMRCVKIELHVIRER